jgi:acyl-CoA synthetase (AMP-forming)/AMP-acid ligase II
VLGLPIRGVEVKLVDDEWRAVPDGEDGKIAIRGHNVVKGYLNRPETTAEAIRDGWFRTGDIGRRDGDGYYYIVDRAKDMIVRGRDDVDPRELEEVLLTHPAVSLAAVIGVPHGSHGEEVKACLILAPGATVTEAELVAWCGRLQVPTPGGAARQPPDERHRQGPQARASRPARSRRTLMGYPVRSATCARASTTMWTMWSSTSPYATFRPLRTPRTTPTDFSTRKCWLTSGCGASSRSTSSYT